MKKTISVLSKIYNQTLLGADPGFSIGEGRRPFRKGRQQDFTKRMKLRNSDPLDPQIKSALDHRRIGVQTLIIDAMHLKDSRKASVACIPIIYYFKKIRD